MQSNKIKKEYSVIILAAGKSTRMGRSKAFLKYNEQETFIEHIINQYIDFGCKQIIVVSNVIDIKWFLVNIDIFPTDKNIRIVVNHHPEWHRFYSLKLAAEKIINEKHVFVHNVDNPFVDTDMLIELMINRMKADYIIPEFNGKGGHPILLSEKIIADVKVTQEDQLHFKDFLNQYPKKKVKVDDEKVLININTIDEYHKYFCF